MIVLFPAKLGVAYFELQCHLAAALLSAAIGFGRSPAQAAMTDHGSLNHVQYRRELYPSSPRRRARDLGAAHPHRIALQRAGREAVVTRGACWIAPSNQRTDDSDAKSGSARAGAVRGDAANRRQDRRFQTVNRKREAAVKVTAGRRGMAEHTQTLHPLEIARISHYERIEAANQRNLLLIQHVSWIRGAPRCKQSVSRICLD
jgi:hypothetical protein